MTALVPFAEVLRLDEALVRVGRGAAAVRLAVGIALDALSSSEGHYELGFSSLEAYARERCERTGRWVADTRALARSLSSLPRLRDALRAGAIGWSTAELLARHATPETEAAWLERALGATVRELRAMIARERDASAEGEESDASDATRQLTVRATREDGWSFECARKVAEAVAGPMSPDGLLQTLLAEAFSTLLELAPPGAEPELLEIERLECDAAAEAYARDGFRAQMRHWREDAEASCENRVPVRAACESRDFDEPPHAADDDCSTASSPEALDGVIRRLCAELAERDLALGLLAERANKAEVWRRLGFASEIQYARERVGVSLSSLKAKRILAARSARVPELGSALASGRLGYEAAYLLSRIVTPATVNAWIRRAERRTVKHLREEVEATELLIRTGHGREQLPLDERSLHELFELERCIVSGDLLGRDRDSSAGEGAKSNAHSDGQMSGTLPNSARNDAGSRVRWGHVTLRWSVTEATFRFWRALERAFSRLSSRNARSDELRAIPERKFLPNLAARPSACTAHGVGRAAGVFQRVSAGCLQVHEPRLHAQGRNAASPRVSLARRERRRRERGVALRVVSPRRRSRGEDRGGAAGVANSLAHR
ncbi:MAG TPA: hypothetical protein VF103_15230 [Polyangiaceae bacterium]